MTRLRMEWIPGTIGFLVIVPATRYTRQTTFVASLIWSRELPLRRGLNPSFCLTLGSPGDRGWFYLFGSVRPNDSGSRWNCIRYDRATGMHLNTATRRARRAGTHGWSS